MNSNESVGCVCNAPIYNPAATNNGLCATCYKPFTSPPYLMSQTVAFVCPSCHTSDIDGEMMCDNGCATIFCKCGTEYYATKGKIVQGHSPYCGTDF